MSAPALICDTGALLDYLDVGAADHREFREKIDEARTRYVPGLVLTELDYFLRNERWAMYAFIAELGRGAFTYVPPTIDLLDRAAEIDRTYADLALGLVDTSVMALAEQLGVYRVATRDVRHFAPVRLRGGRGLDLVARPMHVGDMSKGGFKLHDASGDGEGTPKFAGTSSATKASTGKGRGA